MIHLLVAYTARTKSDARKPPFTNDCWWPLWTLTDNDSVKTSYEFDILFMDSAENYGLLDPKIQNN